MTLPNNPDELVRRASELDDAIARLQSQLQRSSEPAQTRRLQRKLDELTKQRVRLQFFLGDTKPQRPKRAAARQASAPAPVAAPRKSGGGCFVLLGISAVGVLLVGGMAAWLLVRVDSHSEPAPQAAKQIAEVVAPTPEQPALGSVQISWSGKVTRVDGIVSLNQACVVNATLDYLGKASSQSDVYAVRVKPEIRCGSRVLYRHDEPRKNEKTKGMPKYRMNEEYVPYDEAYRYWLSYDDTGVRDAPAQVRIDSRKRSVQVWQTQPSSWRVEIEIDEWAMRQGSSSLLPGRKTVTDKFANAIAREGTVTARSGMTSVTDDMPCKVVVKPNQSEFNCRVHVHCGGQLLYGDEKSGYNYCKVENDVPVYAFDRSAANGDPILKLELNDNRVTVSDDRAATAFSVTIGLAPAALSNPLPPTPTASPPPTATATAAPATRRPPLAPNVPSQPPATDPDPY